MVCESHNVFPQRLRLAMEANGVSSTYALAKGMKEAGYTANSQTFDRYLRGTQPTVPAAANLAQYLMVSLDWLAGLDCATPPCTEGQSPR